MGKDSGCSSRRKKWPAKFSLPFWFLFCLNNEINWLDLRNKQNISIQFTCFKCRVGNGTPVVEEISEWKGREKYAMLLLLLVLRFVLEETRVELRTFVSAIQRVHRIRWKESGMLVERRWMTSKLWQHDQRCHFHTIWKWNLKN